MWFLLQSLDFLWQHFLYRLHRGSPEAKAFGTSFRVYFCNKMAAVSRLFVTSGRRRPSYRGHIHFRILPANLKVYSHQKTILITHRRIVRPSCIFDLWPRFLWFGAAFYRSIYKYNIICYRSYPGSESTRRFGQRISRSLGARGFWSGPSLPFCLAAWPFLS